MRVTHEAAHLSAWVVVLDRLLPSAGARRHLFLRVAGVDCEVRGPPDHLGDGDETVLDKRLQV